MNREYHKWLSPRLEREMELLVFGHGGERVLVFPTRQGRFYDYENWGLVDAVRDRIEAGQLQLFCVDSVDSESLYDQRHPPRQRIARHVAYQEYVVQEVVPFTRSRNESPILVAHGCSIGAYHAVDIALLHPTLFRKVVALSGRYDLTCPAGSFRDLFDGCHEAEIDFHTPIRFVADLADSEALALCRRLEIVLVVGERDPFCEQTCELSRLLCEKGIPQRLAIWEGEAHQPRSWREMVRLYLRGADPDSAAAA